MASSHSLLKKVPAVEKVTPVKATFEDEIDKSRFANSVLLANISGKKHSGEFIKSTISLIQNNSQYITNLNILVTGSLQRWHFWCFCESLSDTQIIKLFADASYKSANEMASYLANKFYQIAKKAEDNFLFANSGMFLAYLSGKMRVSFLPWDSMISSNLEAKEQDDPRSYRHFFHEITEAYRLIPEFSEVINKTCEHVMHNSQARKQCKRLSILIPGLRSMTAEQWLTVARISSLNYQLEKCTVLLLGLFDRKYTSIISADIFNQALIMGARCFPKKQVPWVYITHEEMKLSKKPLIYSPINSSSHRIIADLINTADQRKSTNGAFAGGMPVITEINPLAEDEDSDTEDFEMNTDPITSVAYDYCTSSDEDNDQAPELEDGVADTIFMDVSPNPSDSDYNSSQSSADEEVSPNLSSTRFYDSPPHKNLLPPLNAVLPGGESALTSSVFRRKLSYDYADEPAAKDPSPRYEEFDNGMLISTAVPVNRQRR
jgi:hypothetical protein